MGYSSYTKKTGSEVWPLLVMAVQMNLCNGGLKFDADWWFFYDNHIENHWAPNQKDNHCAFSDKSNRIYDMNIRFLQWDYLKQNMLDSFKAVWMINRKKNFYFQTRSHSVSELGSLKGICAQNLHSQHYCIYRIELAIYRVRAEVGEITNSILRPSLTQPYLEYLVHWNQSKLSYKTLRVVLL